MKYTSNNFNTRKVCVFMEKDYPVNYPEFIIPKADGVTDSEKKLIRLGYQSFFSLWSYPNPYRKHNLDKELCDLLVIFGDDIIIFSDKDIAFPLEGNIKTNWRRWYRKAITKSCNQLCGAMSWLKKYPDRIALDPKGEVDFPLNIQVTTRTRFHLVSVVHGIKDACINYFDGGDGGLVIDNFTPPNAHLSDNCEPFRIGTINNDTSNFIHVFDDASYALVLEELNTIQDFIDYLEDRKQFLLTSKKIQATGECEILAIHLDAAIHGKKNGLTQLLTKDYGSFLLDEGLWDEFTASTAYINWKKQTKISYFWDDLLKRTIEYIEKGQTFHTSHPTIDGQSKLLYQMAKANRYRRARLSEGILSFFCNTPKDKRGTRIIMSQEDPNIAFVLLLLPKPNDVPYEEYRSIRGEMLSDYCAITKADHPELLHVFGIAHATIGMNDDSEEFAYLDATYWTNEDHEKALHLKQEYADHGLLAERTATRIKRRMPEFAVKGKDRNKPCPCGSGIKYKKCCGRNS